MRAGLKSAAFEHGILLFIYNYNILSRFTPQLVVFAQRKILK